MVDFKKMTKWFAGGIVGVIALSGAYYQGLIRKPSYQQLPPAVQRSITEQEHLLEATLQSTINDYKSGDLSSCQKKLKEAIALVIPLAKQSEQYTLIEDKLYRYQDILKATKMAQESLNTNRVFLDKLEMPLTSTQIAGVFQWTAHPQPIDLLYDTYTQPQVINDPLMAKALLAVYIQMMEEYLSLTIALREKLEKAAVADEIKTAMKKINGVIESLTSHLGDIKKEFEGIGK